MPDKSTPFRVIIVGGGISGIALSHSLQLANIDHIVLEKHHEVYSYAGGPIVVWPHTARIFDQFGVLEKVQQGCHPITEEFDRGPDGKVLSRAGPFVRLTKEFDQQPLLLDRHQCVRHLYDGLPDKSRIATNKRVVDIAQDDNGVQVTLDDGSVEKGDIVVGCDGVHSMVREAMWKHANETKPGTITDEEKESLTSEYGIIFACASNVPGLGPGDSHAVLGHGSTMLVFTQPDRAYIGLMFKHPEKKVWPFKQKYTEEDMQKMAEKHASDPVTETIVMGDIWKHATRKGMVAIEEGVLKHWHSGRIKLLGDSAHKMSTDLAMGANTAIEGTVALANLLHRELKADRNRHLTAAEIEALFSEQDKICRYRATEIARLSGEILRTNSLQGFWRRINATYIFPYIAPFVFGGFTKFMAGGQKLDYVSVRITNESAEGWKAKKKGPSYGSRLLTLSTVGAVGAFAWFRYGDALTRMLQDVL